MKLALISKSKEKLSLVVEGLEYWFVNSLRRIMMNDVPVLAIEDVEFKKNDSALYDEIIALRLGLIPLKTNLKTMNLKDQCSCKGAGCSMCEVVFTLKEKGPKMVYAKHLKTKDYKIAPVYPDMPLVKLDKGQALEFEAIAVLGRGREHMKWSPGLAFFKYYPEIKITHSKCPKDTNGVASVCPLGILEVKQGKLAVNPKKALNCHLCEACVEAAPGCVTLEYKENKHIFVIESWGQLSCSDIVLEATKRYESRLLEISKLMRG